MTSVESMQSSWLRPAASIVRGVGWCLSMMIIACLLSCNGPQLVRPSEHVAPYAHEQLFAVAPFANESGTSHVEPERLADMFTYELEHVAGVRTLPVNRVIAAMRLLKLSAIQTDADAMALMRVLDVDGIIIGTVTAYDAYAPMQLGLAVQLMTRDATDAHQGFDPHEAARATHGEAAHPAPTSFAQASGVFDASNHQTRAALAHYARGRVAPESAFGERIYDNSMELYSRFVSHELIGELLAVERSRATRLTQSTTVQ